MQEILTAVTYLVVWLGCEKVFNIESGLWTVSYTHLTLPTTERV